MRKITAIAYTLCFILENLVMPFFMKWYQELLQYNSNEFKFPPGVFFTFFFLWLGQIALAVYLWARVFDKNMR